jgi:hypothetical protein
MCVSFRFIYLGAKVSGTIRKGILDPAEFKGQEIELMLGYVSALSGCCIWLILATILNLPVSGTHSIVGATIGMAIVSKGFMVIQWLEVLKIGKTFIRILKQASDKVLEIFLYLQLSLFMVHIASFIRSGIIGYVCSYTKIYTKSCK